MSTERQTSDAVPVPSSPQRGGDTLTKPSTSPSMPSSDSATTAAGGGGIPATADSGVAARTAERADPAEHVIVAPGAPPGIADAGRGVQGSGSDSRASQDPAAPQTPAPSGSLEGGNATGRPPTHQDNPLESIGKAITEPTRDAAAEDEQPPAVRQPASRPAD